MALSENTSGSQTAVIDTEHTLVTITVSNIYILAVDLTNMALGDELVLRIKTKVRTGDTAALAFSKAYSQIPHQVVVYSDPIPSPHSVAFTLEQEAGTGRVFSWAIYELE